MQAGKGEVARFLWLTGGSRQRLGAQRHAQGALPIQLLPAERSLPHRPAGPQARTTLRQGDLHKHPLHTAHAAQGLARGSHLISICLH